MTDKTAIIYARVSTTRQAEEELPVESQIEQCTRKAEELGARVVQVFRDDGLSGRSDTRPAFQDAIRHCELSPPTYLITWSTSRFARNRVDAGWYKRRLDQVGTKIVYVSMNIDTSRTDGWILDGVMELFDELYSRQVAADTTRSMLKNAREGFWNGGTPPLGYEPVPADENPKRKRLRPVAHEADLVRRIFRMRLEGAGSRAIAMRLNEEGALNRGKRWSKTTVADLLRNETVIGNVVFGKKDRASGRDRPRSEWLVVPAHEPIIDDVTWEAVQAMMDTDAAAAEGSPKSTFLFTGLLRCGACGSSMQIETAKGRSRRYEYYNCRNWQRYGECENRRIPAREFDEWLMHRITSEVFTARNLSSIVAELHDACGTWTTDHRRRRAAVVGRLQEIEGRNRKLYEVLELMGKDAPNLGDLTRRLRANNVELKSLEEQLARIDAEQAPDVTVTEADVAELADTLNDILRTTENVKKTRAFFASIVESISVLGEEVRLEYRPHVLVQQRAVHSAERWLPGTDSNRRPSD